MIKKISLLEIVKTIVHTVFYIKNEESKGN